MLFKIHSLFFIASFLLMGASSCAEEAQLFEALTTLNKHINKESLLKPQEIVKHKATIDANKLTFGDNAQIISASFDLIASYDNQIGAMWSKGSPTQRGFNRKQVADNLHWTIYQVMQKVLDESYNAQNLRKHRKLFEGFKFGCADVFPGRVIPPSNPKRSEKVTVDASFPKSSLRETQQWTEPARQPTGTYLTPGTMATVTVPKKLINQGYQIRVGGHSSNLHKKNVVKRLERCSLLYEVESVKTVIASPLGGNIYLEVPSGADAGIVKLSLQNVVRSPFFSNQPHHKTSLEEWLTVERQHEAPWADFQSEKYMMLVPTSWINQLDDPITLMANWDKSIDIANELMGFPKNRGKETIYNVVDVVIKANAYAPGYPSVNATINPHRKYNGNHNHHLIRGPQYAASYEFHELGHAYLFSKLPGEVESAVNLLHVPIMQQGFGHDWDTAFATSRDFGKNPHRTLDNTAVAWMTSFNFFLYNAPMHEKEKKYQLKGHAKFVVLAKLFGWEALSKYFSRLNQDLRNNNKRRINVDDMIFDFSIIVGEDVTPLFHFWGCPPKKPGLLKKRLAAAKVKPSKEIYQLLRHYRKLVPKDNAAFQEFAFNWWGKKPVVDGYWTESEHARQWDNKPLYKIAETRDRVEKEQLPNGEIYTEKTAAMITAKIDRLLGLYFPGH